MIEYYNSLKLAHMGFAFTSVTLFIVRAFWSISGSRHLQKPWVRISPHFIDTLLLISAIFLALSSHQYPGQQPWLTAKVAALAIYIIFGSLAIKRAKTARLKTAFLALSLLTFAYMVSVAFTKSPLPFG